MREFTIELLFKLSVGAASGLHLIGNHLYVVSDNSSFIYRYAVSDQSMAKVPLLEDASDLIIKAQKPDFESIAENDGSLYIFGSGSTANRNTCIKMDLRNRKPLKLDLRDFYTRLQQRSSIEPADFNIEGAVFTNDKLLLFQRGNGISAQNGIFIIDKDDFINQENLSYKAIDLPPIGGFPSTFTDAVSVDGMIYFLATAENSASTYHDGEVAGSMIGRLDADLCVKDYIVIGKEKFEGMTIFQTTEKEIVFLICEDNDSDSADAGIFKLTIFK